MLVLVVVLSTVAAVLVACVLPRWADSPSQQPLASFDTRAAATNERIVALHRELGIDPIFDPIPEEPRRPEEGAPKAAWIAYTSALGAGPGSEVWTKSQMIEFADHPPRPKAESGPVHPLRVRTCPYDCGWTIGGSPLITQSALANHLDAKHEVPPPWMEALQRSVTEARRQAEQEP